jgi:hypothetical protein
MSVRYAVLRTTGGLCMETNATALTGAPAGRRLNGYRLATVLGALMLTLLLEALDQTVVGTAMPKIIGSLNGFDRYTWVVTAYQVVSVTILRRGGPAL